MKKMQNKMSGRSEEGLSWKDSLATKIGAYALSVVLILGAVKLYYEFGKKVSQENHQRYGFLIGETIEKQRKYIRGDLEKKCLLFRLPPPLGINESVKDYTVNQIVKDLK